jgi:hypothetical protein
MADNRQPAQGRKSRLIVVGLLVAVIAIGVNVAVLRRAQVEKKRADERTAQQIAQHLRENGLDAATAKKFGEESVEGMNRLDYNPADLTTATNATYVFADHLSKEEYASIYYDSTEDFQRTVDRDYLLRMLKVVNDKTGPCGNLAIVLTGTGRDVGGPYVQQKFTRKCSKINETQEQLIWAIRDGNAKLLGYRLFNPEFADLPKQ